MTAPLRGFMNSLAQPSLGVVPGEGANVQEEGQSFSELVSQLARSPAAPVLSPGSTLAAAVATPPPLGSPHKVVAAASLAPGEASEVVTPAAPGWSLPMSVSFAPAATSFMVSTEPQPVETGSAPAAESQSIDQTFLQGSISTRAPSLNQGVLTIQHVETHAEADTTSDYKPVSEARMSSRSAQEREPQVSGIVPAYPLHYQQTPAPVARSISGIAESEIQRVAHSEPAKVTSLSGAGAKKAQNEKEKSPEILPETGGDGLFGIDRDIVLDKKEIGDIGKHSNHVAVQEVSVKAVPKTKTAGSAEIGSPENILPMRINVTEISTHFPAVVAHALTASRHEGLGQAQDLIPEQRLASTEALLSAPNGIEGLRVLRFEMEPADLGGVVVKMRVRDTRVEIHIEAESASTTSLLSQSRNALTSAIEHKGMTLHAFDVATQSSASPTSQFTSNDSGGASDRGGVAQGGFSSEEHTRQDQRQAPQTSEQEGRNDEASLSFDALSGVIL